MNKLAQYKREVDAFLSSFLASKRKEFARVNGWGTDALQKIQAIASEGKAIRGSLVLLTHDLLDGKVKDDALRVAAAYELIQTGLLIHDDIMDHDALRRGKPALHTQYKSEALAMCVGDILFFLAHELLATLVSPKEVSTAIQTLSNQIFEEVGIAQMQDMSLSHSEDIPAKEEIISLYRFKTARYTFALPMMAGAILAHADPLTVDLLEKLGENMGILFQIRNDEKGIAGDTRENKKTLARYYPTVPEINKYHRQTIACILELDNTLNTTALKKLLTFITNHE